MQTLTLLIVGDNQIRDRGAQHISNALQQNQVIFSLFSIYYDNPRFYTDTPHSENRAQWNQ